MADINNIDIEYDFAEDYYKNRDPDKYNKILRNWHKLLWGKHLPYTNNIFSLVEKGYGLFHKSTLGEYYLTSDGIVHTYSEGYRNPEIINQIPKEEIDNFYHIACRIGAYILFPGYQIDRKQTINGARGCNPKISDRFDLTLECIRLFYNDVIDYENNPLGEVINRYNNFFKLFNDFKGYCEFFLLQDLTLENYSKIKFHLPFNGFNSKPRPSSVEEYRTYMNNSIDFVNNRNNRIKNYIMKNMITIEGNEYIDDLSKKLSKNFGRYKRGEISQGEYERIDEEILKKNEDDSRKKLEDVLKDTSNNELNKNE